MPRVRKLPLKKKVEVGLLAYLEALELEALEGYHFFRGSSAVKRVLPAVSVMVENVEDAWPESMPKNCTAVVYFWTAIDGETTGGELSEEQQDERREESEALHDDAMAAVEEALQDLAAMQLFLNKVNLTNRPVTAFYLYDVIEAGQSTAVDGRAFGNGLRYTVRCEAQDN
jgi:hypothetical protein